MCKKTEKVKGIEEGLEQLSSETEKEQTVEERAEEMMEEEFDRLKEVYPEVSLVKNKIHLVSCRWKDNQGQFRANARPKFTHYNYRVKTERAPTHHTIIANRRHLETGKEEEFRDTVRHEFAHLIDYKQNDYCSGHDYRWRQYANKLGATPSKQGNIPLKSDPLYYIVCTEGCFANKRYRKSKTVKHPERYHCSGCGASLKSYTAEEWEEL